MTPTMRSFVVVIAVVIAGLSAAWFYQQHRMLQSPTTTATPSSHVDFRDATYSIDGTKVVLVHGSATTPIADSSATTDTEYFGNDAMGDLNGDGKADVAFLVTQSAGGTGTFYYVLAALKTDAGYTGTNALFLGDRIAPQTTQIKDGQIIVNYADRLPSEPMAAEPSHGVSKRLQVQGTTLLEL